MSDGYCKQCKKQFFDPKINMALEALKKAYRKHCLDDDRIGWAELQDELMIALTELMGDDGFIDWLKEVKAR